MPTLTLYIAQASDLVEVSGGSVVIGGQWLYLGGNNLIAAFRFQNVTIPPGSIINSAVLHVENGDYINNGPATEWWLGELSLNPATFSTVADYNARTRTTTIVTESYLRWEENSWYTTGDLGSIIQEIINQAGWASGNAIALLPYGAWTGFGRYKKIYGWLAGSEYRPYLVIDYTEPPNPGPGGGPGSAQGAEKPGQPGSATPEQGTGASGAASAPKAGTPESGASTQGSSGEPSSVSAKQGANAPNGNGALARGASPGGGASGQGAPRTASDSSRAPSGFSIGGVGAGTKGGVSSSGGSAAVRYSRQTGGSPASALAAAFGGASMSSAVGGAFGSSSGGGFSVQNGASKMELVTSFQNRSFASIGKPPGLEFTPVSYSWASMGGPKAAEFSVTGDDYSLATLKDLLRFGVTISDKAGQAVWWGIISEAEIPVPEYKMTIRIGLEEMRNNISVSYSALADGATGGGTRADTSWASDATSVATYGTKEDKIGDSSCHKEAAALSLQTSLLGWYAYPIAEWTDSYTEGKATMRCIGLFDTLNWKYRNKGTAADTTVADQIADIVTDQGQFLTGSYMEGTFTTPDTNIYRRGDKRSGDEIVRLCKVGTTNGRRLLVSVTQDRQLKIYEEPARYTADYRMVPGRKVSNASGLEVELYKCPVGVWCRMSGLARFALESTQIAGVEAIFIEESEYNCETGELRVQPRGYPEPTDVVELERRAADIAQATWVFISGYLP